MDENNKWLLCINPIDKIIYYYNPKTGKVSYDFPGTEFVFSPVINMNKENNENNNISEPGYISFYISKNENF